MIKPKYLYKQYHRNSKASDCLEGEGAPYCGPCSHPGYCITAAPLPGDQRITTHTYFIPHILPCLTDHSDLHLGLHQSHLAIHYTALLHCCAHNLPSWSVFTARPARPRYKSYVKLLSL